VSRNRTHRLHVEGGVRLDHLAKVVLALYPNARINENSIPLDLGVPEEVSIPEPVTEAESAVEWGVKRHADQLRGQDPDLDALLDKLVEHPTVKRLGAEHERKRKVNEAAGRKVARREDDERNGLQALLARRPPKTKAETRELEVDIEALRRGSPKK